MKKKLSQAAFTAMGIAGAAAAICIPIRAIRKQAEKAPRKFGATYMTMNNPYFEVLDESIRESVEANGDILITRDPAQSQERQNQQIRDMIDEGVTAIFLNPVDWKAVSEGLRLCREAGIPVFNVDSNVYDQEYVVSVIQSDNYKAGVQCAQDMMEKKEEARILVMTHENIQSTNLRIQGFLDTIEGHPQYQVVGEAKSTSEFETSMEAMDLILRESLEFDVVIGGNDPTALGALAALQSSHVEDNILIYGIDGSPDAKAMIRKGLLEGTSSQLPVEMGKIAVDTAYAHLKGETVKSSILVDVVMVTEENLDSVGVDGWL
ncbi:MAG: sugar ABC transporter substrate-binding protein [Eubacteriales bacterium]|nr:sugar ABC transporter substrate-binding protein [Eubacteriales bacterium]